MLPTTDFFSFSLMPLTMVAWFFAGPAQAQPAAAPIFQYAIFYNGLLEFSTCGNMVINGPVLCNTNIYVGAGGGSTLTFNNTVTSAGLILAPTNNGSSWGDPTNYNSAWKTTFNGNPPYLQGMQPVDLLLGTNDPHGIIEIPPPDEPFDSLLGQQRLFNLAQVVLLVSNSTVTAMIRQSDGSHLAGEDPSPVIYTCASSPAAVSASFPFLSLTSLFRDAREKKTNITAQIDLGKYAVWLGTNAGINEKFPAGSGNYPTLLYVADTRSTTSNQLAVVRLTNGVAPPANGGQGFSLATPNPLYVWGNYNCSNSAYLGTTNTSTALPCALYSDALTLLSSSWKDSSSYGSVTKRVAASADTVNAAIITGIVPTTGPDNLHFSGGIQNLPRLLEDWSSSTLWLNTSIVNIYNSKQATNQFLNPTTYYSTPTRRFSFDLNFADPNRPLPPGTPRIVRPPVVLAITDQPRDQSITAGDSAGFSVTADGVPPFAYQWQFNHVAIPAETNAALLVTNTSSADAGIYSVVVSNAFGYIVSSNATLTVNYFPAIVTPPANRAAVVGFSATLQVVAAGTAPLCYQWLFNGTNRIASATNASLVLPPVTFADAGQYSVVVTNLLGSVTSSPAVLTIYSSAGSVLSSVTVLSSNQIRFDVNGVPGLNYAVEASTNLNSWSVLTTNVSPFSYLETNTSGFPQRFFRAAFVP